MQEEGFWRPLDYRPIARAAAIRTGKAHCTSPTLVPTRHNRSIPYPVLTGDASMAGINETSGHMINMSEPGMGQGQ